MSVLETIVAETRARLAAHPPDRPALDAQLAAAALPLDALAALAAPGVRIIAELKRAAPSSGALAPTADPTATAARYAEAGAAAISVLTEPNHFHGSLADLALATAAATPFGVPTLCKDFIVDPVQLLLARAHGASLVLLIVRALSDAALVALRESAELLGMQALVEVHDAPELERAVASGARLIGVNNRNLDTLAIDLAVAERLRPLIPDACLPVAESGVHTPADLQRLAAAGYRRFLIGSSLMRAPDPALLLRQLLDTGTTLS